MSKIVVIPRSQPLPAPKRGIEYVYAPATEAGKVAEGRHATYGGFGLTLSRKRKAKYASPMGMVRHSRNGVIQHISVSNPCPKLHAVDATWDKRTKRFRLKRQKPFACGVGAPKASVSKRIMDDAAFEAMLIRGRKLMRYRKRG